jgi:CRP-like cAMP-binding protein
MNFNTLKNSTHWDKFSYLFKKEEIPGKTTLLTEGQVSKKAYFIEKGCLRLWFNNHGKDLTFQFFFEGDSVSSIESFRTKQPSVFSLESIEPCVIYSISQKDFQFIIENSHEIKNEMEEQIFQRLLFYQQLFLSRIKDNPEKRYKELVEKYPKISQRLPQHYIASYLGITSVSLSRIRNRR